MQPTITPFARRLAENAGVAWWTLTDPQTTITEDDVLAHLTDVVTGATTTQLSAAEIAEGNFSDLAASLADALQDLLAGPPEVNEYMSTGHSTEFFKLEPDKSSAADIFDTLDADTAEPGSAPESAALRQLQVQLEAEHRAHAQTKAQLSELRAVLRQQQLRAAQLKPLSSEIRRLESALGRANAELERRRPFEALVGMLQGQLEQAQTKKAKLQRLCGELQEQLAQEQLANDTRGAQERSRWFFRRRSP